MATKEDHVLDSMRLLTMATYPVTVLLEYVLATEPDSGLMTDMSDL